MSDVVIYELGPSPNNMKVRIALNYKGISFDKVAVAFDDTERKDVVEVSGQPLTPVLKHGDSVIFDSGAILRYIDATFRDDPQLFFADRERMREAEDLEKWARSTLSEPVGIVFNECMSGDPDLAACERASAMLHEATAQIESRLESSPWLMGEHMSVVDITAAPTMFYGVVPEAMISSHPEMPLQFFYDNLKLGEGREPTREWCMRVMAYDR